MRLHPWGEAALAVALATFGGAIGFVTALMCTGLMVAYLWLVTRAHVADRNASCACFGARKIITRVTIIRNVWLTLLAGGSAAVIWTNPILGGSIARGASEWQLLAGACLAAVTTALVLWPEPVPDSAVPEARPSALAPAAHPAGGADADALDYVRTRTPSVPVTTASGELVDLRLLSLRKPLLLVAVSEHCSWCERTIEHLPRYRQLLPEVDMRLLIQAPPEGSTLTETSEPQSLHDPYGYVRRSIADWPTPTAVLFGADGMLAGGPEIGFNEIESFIDDIYESLHGERPESSSLRN